MLQNILLVANILVCCALIGVVLMQRSEGGALGMGGGPSGFMTARGAGDLLTRTTWILFVVFLVLSVSLTMLGGGARSVTEGAHIQAIDPSKLNQPPAATVPATPTPGAPTTAPGASPLTAPTSGLPGAAPAAPPSNTGGFRGFPTAQEQMQAAQQQQQQMMQQQAAQRAAAMQAAQQQAAAQAATPHPVQVPAPVVVPPLAPAPSDSTPAPATNP